ncbi:SDR family NAD(P)-dependent oxidoreductase [Mycobacterium arosiense]|nr:SDR family oxidoreductase [Mycobacterium arosiense]
MVESLDGKVALITGGGSGIGRASACAMARAGIRAVAVLDIDSESSQETMRLVVDGGAQALPITCDVGDPEALADAFAAVEREYGGIDLVLNNAGLVGGPPTWPDTPLARAETMIRVNLGGVVYGTQLGVAAMRRRGGGAIVNTASIGGFIPSPDDAVYVATKAGVIMLSRSCRRLHREGIRVNAVCPGVVDTPMLHETGEEGPAAWLGAGLARLRLLTADQVAEAILHIMTDNEYAGQVVTVDNPESEDDQRPILSVHSFTDVQPTLFGGSAR